MNENNLNYLVNQVKYTGFGDHLSTAIKGKISKGETTFTIPFNTTYHQKKIDVELYFSKSMNTDMFFFNAYKITLTQTNQQQYTQMFYIHKEGSVTLKEAYNLLSGRSVYKQRTTALSSMDTARFFPGRKWKKLPHSILL